MRSFTVSCVVLSAIVLLAGQASAKTFPLEGSYSTDQLKKLCNDNGGRFEELGSSNASLCIKDCPKEGGGTGVCSVYCEDGFCTGNTPDRKVPTRRDALGILRYAPDLASPRDPIQPLRPMQPRHDPAESGGTVVGPADFSASRNGTCCLYKGRTARLVRSASGCVNSGGRVAPLHYCGKEDGPTIRDHRTRPH